VYFRSGADVFFNAKSRLLAELSLRDPVPAIYEYNEFARAGGLMSNGCSSRNRIDGLASIWGEFSRATTLVGGKHKSDEDERDAHPKCSNVLFPWLNLR
jgi:hypothetical protein